MHGRRHACLLDATQAPGHMCAWLLPGSSHAWPLAAHMRAWNLPGHMRASPLAAHLLVQVLQLAAWQLELRHLGEDGVPPAMRGRTGAWEWHPTSHACGGGAARGVRCRFAPQLMSSAPHTPAVVDVRHEALEAVDRVQRYLAFILHGRCIGERSDTDVHMSCDRSRSTHLDSVKGIREAVLLAELENNLDHTVMRGEKCCRRPVRCLLDDTASIAHSLSRLYLQRHGDGRV